MSKIYQISDEVVALCGSPGSGKTYISACMALTHIRLSPSNIVCTNVPFIEHPQIIQLPDVPSITEFSDRAGKNVLFIIDEITRIWGNHPLKEVRPEFDTFVAMIRHKGSRIIVITQSVAMLPLVFRSRVSSVYQLVSTRDFKVPYTGLCLYDLEYLFYNLTHKPHRMFRLEVTKFNVSGRRKVYDSDVAFFNSSVFSFYRSVTMGEGWQDPYKGPFLGLLFILSKCWFHLVIFLGLVIIFFYYIVFGHIFDVLSYFGSNLLSNNKGVKNEKV